MRPSAKVREQCAEFAEAMETTTRKAIVCLEAGIEDTLAVMALPAKYRHRLKSMALREWLIREVRRRERRHLDMEEFHEWLAERQTD